MSDILDYPITERCHPVRCVPNIDLENIVCITFPHNVFLPNATCFGQFQDTANGNSYRMILQIFAHISANPSLGYAVASTNDVEIEKHDRAFYENEHGAPNSRIRRYMERIPSIHNPKVTLAWRLYLFVADSKFCFAVAFENLIKRNTIEYKKYTDMNPKFRSDAAYNPKIDAHKTVLNTASFMNNIVCVYTEKSMSDDDVMVSFASIESTQRIPSSVDVAAPLMVFSLERSFEHHVKENADPRLFDIGLYLDADSIEYDFPIPENVWEISNFAFTPRAILRMRFFNVTQQQIPSPTKCQQTEMNAKFLNFKNFDMDSDDNDDNDIKRMSIRNDIELKKLQQQNLSDDEMSSEMSKFLEYTRAELASVISREANLSSSVHSMVDWFESGSDQQKRDGVSFSPFNNIKKVDPVLSPFANMIIRMMVQFEVISKVANAHLPALMCTLALMDATRHEYAMKLNVILGGPSVASKSYIINLITALSIPATVQPITHQTRRALNTDTPIVDQVHAYDEMDLASLGYNPQDSATGDNTIKASTTNGQITNQVFHVDEKTGKRTTRTKTTDCMITRIGGTNDQLRLMPEALASRYQFILVEGLDHPDRSILDLINSSDNTMIRTKKFAFKNEYRFYQYISTLVFKAIQINAMADIDIEITSIMFTRMLKNLNSKGYQMSNPRVLQRMKIVARMLTLMNAIYVCFMSDRALYPPETPFRIEMIYELCPYLVCTEEIAIFAFTMFAKDIVNSSEYEMMMATMVLINRQVDPENPESDEERWACRGSEETSIMDHNYYFLKIPGGKGPSFSMYAHMVKSVITNKRVSIENIEFVLRGCRDRCLKVRNYQSTDAFGQQLESNQAGESSTEGSYRSNNIDTEYTPTEMAEFIAKRCDRITPIGPNSSKNIMIFVKSPPGIKILRHYVEQCAKDMYHEKSETYKTPILEAIDTVQHKYTRERYILTAMQCPGFQESAPHVLRVVKLSKSNNILQITNSNSVTTFEKQILNVEPSDVTTGDIIEVDGDLEEYRLYARGLDPGVNMDEEIYERARPQHYEDRSSGVNSYPSIYIDEIKSKQERTRAVKRGNAIANNSDVTSMGHMVKKRVLESSEDISRRVEINERNY